MLSSELAAQYYHRRKQLIQTSATFKDYDFIYCKDKWEVFKGVIKRFSSNPPRWEQFKTEWKDLADRF